MYVNYWKTEHRCGFCSSRLLVFGSDLRWEDGLVYDCPLCGLTNTVEEAGVPRRLYKAVRSGKRVVDQQTEQQTPPNER